MTFFTHSFDCYDGYKIQIGKARATATRRAEWQKINTERCFVCFCQWGECGHNGCDCDDPWHGPNTIEVRDYTRFA